MTRDWSRTRETYVHFVEYARQRNPPVVKWLDGMVPLVEAIERSRYATKVRGWCEHYDLCISPTQKYDRAYLRIAPLGGGRLRIAYSPDPFDEAWNTALVALPRPVSLMKAWRELTRAGISEVERSKALTTLEMSRERPEWIADLKKWRELIRAGIWGEEVEGTKALVTLERSLERLGWIVAADRTL